MKKAIYLTFGIILLNTSGVHGSATVPDNTDTSKATAAPVVFETPRSAQIDTDVLNDVMNIRNLNEAREQRNKVTAFLDALAHDHLIDLIQKNRLINFLASEDWSPERQTNLDWELQEVLNRSPNEMGISQYRVSPTTFPVKISSVSSREHRGEGLRVKAFLAFLEKQYGISATIREEIEDKYVFACLFLGGTIYGREMWTPCENFTERTKPLLANEEYQNAFAEHIKTQASETEEVEEIPAAATVVEVSSDSEGSSTDN